MLSENKGLITLVLTHSKSLSELIDPPKDLARIYRPEVAKTEAVYYKVVAAICGLRTHLF